MKSNLLADSREVHQNGMTLDEEEKRVKNEEEKILDAESR